MRIRTALSCATAVLLAYGAPGAAPAANATTPLGHITIKHAVGQTHATYGLSGALADPTLWTCSDNGTALPYRVTCLPLPTTERLWTCDMLDARVWTYRATSRARTTLDCDGGAPEAQTNVVAGPGSDVAPATFAPIPALRCTVDAASLPAVPDYTAMCGQERWVDPRV